MKRSQPVRPCLQLRYMGTWLGHISQKYMKQLLDHKMISSLEVSWSNNIFTCNVCIQANIAWTPFPKESTERAKKKGDRIYSDVWGPSRHQNIDKKYYYISFTDNYSRESVIYLMKTKDKAFQKYKLYKAMLAWQRGIQIKILIIDRGGKYTSTEFNKYLESQGTNHRLTVHDTLEWSCWMT